MTEKEVIEIIRELMLDLSEEDQLKLVNESRMANDEPIIYLNTFDIYDEVFNSASEFGEMLYDSNSKEFFDSKYFYIEHRRLYGYGDMTDILGDVDLEYFIYDNWDDYNDWLDWSGWEEEYQQIEEYMQKK